MSPISLKANETKILAEAGSQDGRITFPNRIKESTRQRIAGLFTKYNLAELAGEEGELRLTPAGYRAVGIEPPRAAAGTKKALVTDLLARTEGASLDELVAATGWLPHTTRAALSRLRASGQELAKSRRPDGTTAYRLGVPDEVRSAA